MSTPSTDQTHWLQRSFCLQVNAACLSRERSNGETSKHLTPLLNVTSSACLFHVSLYCPSLGIKFLLKAAGLPVPLLLPALFSSLPFSVC